MKKYISNGREYVCSINIGGHIRYIKFRDMGQYANRGVFVTNDPSVANALEAHPRFNQCFFLVDGEIEEKPKQEVRVFDYTYPVKRTQDAIRILIEQHGVKEGEIKKKADVLLKAEELNIAFPNLL